MKPKGFTLIELLIYAGVVAVLLTTVSVFAWQMAENSIRADTQREVDENASLAMAKIIFAIKNASGFSAPALPGNQTDYLILTAPSPTNSVEFRLTDGQITIKEGTGPAYPLTSNLVQATLLRFTNLTNGTAPATFKIEMTISYKNLSGRPEYDAANSLDSSAGLRY